MGKKIERAEEEVNKQLIKEIANRLIQIRRLKKSIKNVEKEIEQLEKGELSPGDIRY